METPVNFFSLNPVSQHVLTMPGISTELGSGEQTPPWDQWEAEVAPARGGDSTLVGEKATRRGEQLGRKGIEAEIETVLSKNLKSSFWIWNSEEHT